MHSDISFIHTRTNLNEKKKIKWSYLQCLIKTKAHMVDIYNSNLIIKVWPIGLKLYHFNFFEFFHEKIRNAPNFCQDKQSFSLFKRRMVYVCITHELSKSDLNVLVSGHR